MEFLTTLPVYGWGVILVAIILLFLLAWFKGLKVSKEGAVTGKSLDEKMEA